MLLAEINPYIRYAKYFNLNSFSELGEMVALDARLFYTVSGYGKINVNSVEYEMSEHTLIIINSGIPYRLHTPDSSVCYIQLNFDFTQNASSVSTPIVPVSVIKFKREMLLDENDLGDLNVIYLRNMNSIQSRLTSILGECMQKLLCYNQKVGHILADCICDCVRHTLLGQTSKYKTDQSKIISYVHTHYNENLTNKSIGKLFGYHPNYVSTMIKRLTGVPLHSYIIRIRLENAANMLTSTNMPVSEIAALCGFCDLAYFSGYFKKHFGTSPSGYRNI